MLGLDRQIDGKFLLRLGPYGFNQHGNENNPTYKNSGHLGSMHGGQQGTGLGPIERYW